MNAYELATRTELALTKLRALACLRGHALAECDGPVCPRPGFVVLRERGWFRRIVLAYVADAQARARENGCGCPACWSVDLPGASALLRGLPVSAEEVERLVAILAMS
jgi:hypothetical protein